MRTNRIQRLVNAAMVVALATSLLVVSATSAPPADADGNDAPASPAAFRSLTSGLQHACTIVSNGSVRCWGENDEGRLGLGDTTDRGGSLNTMGAFLPAVSLGTGRTATALSAGNQHSCALLDNGTTKCWGGNSQGQLGQGNVNNRGDNASEMGDNLPPISLGTGRTPTAISAGDGHTCARLDNGSVKCWGTNGQGRLGLGDTSPRGDAAGEMGDDLPAISLGTGRTATAISAGGAHTCALLDNGSVKCWGANGFGQLGLGDNLARGDAAGEMGDNLPAVNLGTGRTATAISTGDSHSCAILDNGTVKCWGMGFDGRLGQGDAAHRGNDAGEMGDNLPAISLGTGRTAVGITGGGGHTCALLDNATVKCWGDNASGRLGVGDSSARGDAAGEMGNSLPAINLGTGRTATAVAAGEEHTCATLDNGARKCWGNGLPVLGQEDNATRGDSPSEMGDNLPVISLPPAGTISGTVTNAVSGAPLANVTVAVLRTSDFSLATAAMTNGSGNYLTSAKPGDYFLYLLDPSVTFTAGFHANPGVFTATVTDGGAVSTNPTMAPLRGGFSGVVRDQATSTGIGSVNVYVIGPQGLLGGTITAANGTYSITNLPTGNYFAFFVDGTGRRVLEYFNDSPDNAGADSITVTAGTITPNINADMYRP